MTTINALFALGCEASMSDDEPQTATEYADRVAVHTGTRPNWTALKAKRLELETLALIDAFRRAIQSHIDATAGQRSYDSGITCSSYVGSTNPAWAAEAAAFVAWRDAVWTYAYAELPKVQNGERPQPSVEAFIAELPAMIWPA